MCVGWGRDIGCNELLEANGLRHCVTLPLGQLTLLLVSIVCAALHLQRGGTHVSQPGVLLMPRLAVPAVTGRKGEASQHRQEWAIEELVELVIKTMKAALKT